LSRGEIGFVKHRACAAGRSLGSEAHAVVRAPPAGQEQGARRHRAAVECHVAHRETGGHADKPRGEFPEGARCAAPFCGNRHGRAAVRTAPPPTLAGSSSGALTRSSGATASRRSAPPTILENTGAATWPPWCWPAV